MANFEKAIVKTLIHEGGSKVTNDPIDKGGLTKYGISQRAYPNFDIRNLTELQARDIYKRFYWDKIKGDDIIDQSTAENLFDTAVNMGPRTTGKLVQTILNLKVDGIIGSNTVAAINETEGKYFSYYFTIVKIARYAHICNRDRTQARFLLGWINRALGGLS